MYIYLYTHFGSAAFDADHARLGLRADVHCLDLHVDPAHSPRRAVHQMTTATVEGIIVPDDIAYHTPPLEVVKQCALHLGIPVRSVCRHLHAIDPSRTPEDKAEATGSAAFAARRHPVAESRVGNLQNTSPSCA